MKRFLALLALLYLTTLPAWAQTSYKEVETELYARESTLAEMANALETWLSGRATLEHTQSTIKSARSKLASAAPVRGLGEFEETIATEITTFLNGKEHTAEGQRRLFSKLGQATRDRSLALIEWRQAEIAKLKGESDWKSWETSWLPLWKDEAELTYELQLKLLDPEKFSKAENSALLRKLLALQTQAQKIEASQDLEKLQSLSVERLTVLARAAEQLLRMDRTQSRGAVTRVRRLSKRLDALTREFRQLRLKALP